MKHRGPSPPDGGRTKGTLRSGRKESQKGTTREGFSKVIDKIPYVGPTLAFIIGAWGWTGLLLFLSGFLFGVSLVFFGVLPDKVISESYRRTQLGDKKETEVKKDPPIGQLRIQTVPDTDSRQWLQSYVRLITLEGQSLDPNIHIASGAVEYLIQDPTNRSFVWSIEAVPNYELETARGFRITKEGLIQPLELKPDKKMLKFTVPMCDKDDMLIAVVLVTWKHDLGTKELSQLLTSTAI